MCGILFSSFPTVSDLDFSAALTAMQHRGPDAMAIDKFDTVRLGHTRLKIQDLAARANQPFASDDGDYTIVFNGEIYNFKELKNKYQLQVKTTSDTEVLLQLYVRLKEKVLDELIGMFAFVVYHNRTGEIFAARDRLGIKPMYYHSQNGHISFASEIRALVLLHKISDIDMLAVRQYLKARAFFNGRTLYSQLNMLPAGHYYSNDKLVKYWSLPTAQQYSKHVEDQEIFDMMTSAVKYRCISDVPVGSYLSGGVDSTIVAGLSSRPDTWTVGFADDNEFEWSRIAARKFDYDHHEVLIDHDEFLSMAKMMIEHRCEPLSVPNEVLLYKMTKAVKEKNTVVLSGEGADELFFGYDRIFRWAAQGNWDLKEFDQRYSYGTHTDFEILEDILEPVSGRSDCLDKVAVFFQLYHLHGLLRRLDNSTMLCSVEARVPFVDHRFVELMYAVPFSYRMQDGVSKAPLKRIFSDVLPQEVISRPKIGFPVPTAEIFSTGTGSGMDKWLRFNMETLLGERWADIQAEAMSASDK